MTFTEACTQTADSVIKSLGTGNPRLIYAIVWLSLKMLSEKKPFSKMNTLQVLFVRCLSLLG